jgi:ribosomal protein S18 acetylase RimI-like enzyme
MAGKTKTAKAAAKTKAKTKIKTKAQAQKKVHPAAKPDAEPAKLAVRELANDDRAWVVDFIKEHWGAPIVVAHGSVYRVEKLPGFVAESAGARVGLVTFKVEGRGCEVVTLNCERRFAGIGTALLEAVRQEAIRDECVRLWLVTTNDNLDALRFFQRRGFELTRVYRGAIEESRKIKPEIPDLGYHGIPIRDEIELELRLAGSPGAQPAQTRNAGEGAQRP